MASGTANIPASVGFLAMILPYIEENNVASQYNYQADWCDVSNNVAIANQIRTYNCPATPRQPRFDSTAMEDPTTDGATVFGPGNTGPMPPANPNAPGGVSDYWGYNEVDITTVQRFPTYFTAAQVAQANAVGASDFNTPSLQGVLTRGRNGVTRIADITDGTSHTILVLESAGRPFQYGPGGALFGTLANGEGRWADPNGNGKVKGCWPGPGASPQGVQPGFADKKDTAGIVAMNCENYNEPYSFHPGGCNFAFSDGSVQFLNINIPVPVLAQLVTKSGGENIGTGGATFYDW